MVFDVVFVGKLIPRKGLIQLVLASILEHNRINLHVYGEGPLQYFVRFACLMAPKTVFYYGYVSNKDLIREYNRFHYLCVPSMREAFGLVYIEALNAGIPVILLKNEGIYDLVFDHNLGVVLENNKVSSLRNALRKLESKKCVNLPRELEWESIMKIYLDEF